MWGQRKVSLAHAASPVSGLSDAISVVARARNHRNRLASPSWWRSSGRRRSWARTLPSVATGENSVGTDVDEPLGKGASPLTRRPLFCRLVAGLVEKLLQLLAPIGADGEPVSGIDVARDVVGRVVGQPDPVLIVLPHQGLRRIVDS